MSDLGSYRFRRYSFDTSSSSVDVMDELEQRCYDLDAKVRRVEEERDAVMAENDDLQEQVGALKSHVERTSLMQQEKMEGEEEASRQELLRLTEEVARLDAVINFLQENYAVMSDKVKEVTNIKESLKNIMEETVVVKEDFLNLKNHLNLAAKIELQTNEKMYENRLHHLEKMLEEMRHREESFLHIAEETNILKDQVDSLRELSLSTLKCEQRSTAAALTTKEHLTLDEELQLRSASNSLPPLSYDHDPDSPVQHEPAVLIQSVQSISYESSPVPSGPSREGSPVKAQSPVKITGEVKLDSPKLSTLQRNLAASESIMTQTDGVKIVESSLDEDEDGAKQRYKYNCCSDLVAKLWVTLFD